MDLTAKSIALYGRFLIHGRKATAHAIAMVGGRIEKDLTRQSDILVIGQGANNLISSGWLSRRIEAASQREIPVYSENRFWSRLQSQTQHAPTYPIEKLAHTLPGDALVLLNALDLIALENQHCRFSDITIVREAETLLGDGHEIAEVIDILRRARDIAPKGRHRIGTGTGGQAVLNWEDGQTTLRGQGLLPLDENAPLDEVFDAAMLADAEGDLHAADRLYRICVQADRKDAIAPYNLGNILARNRQHKEAILSYGRAIARRPDFAEAYFNRAVVSEAMNDFAKAESDLRNAIKIDRDYPDAIFNLGQLRLKAGDNKEATSLFRRFVDTRSQTHKF